MKKTLIALLCMAPLSAMAFTTDWSHDITVGTGNTSVSFDQSGNKFAASHNSLSISTSDTVDIGVSYSTTLLGALDATVGLDHQADDDNVIGLETSFGQWGATITPSLDWNVNDTDFDSTVKVGYGIFGLDSYYSLDYDVDDTEFSGSEVGVGFGWQVANGFTLTPNLTVPFDSDWDRGTLVAGISLNISFGGSPTE